MTLSLLLVCWPCGPNSIESKCDFSKLEKFEDHIMTCALMIQDLDGHVLVLDLLECVFGGKSVTPPFRVVYISV
jgi:hypothetical protein